MKTVLIQHKRQLYYEGHLIYADKHDVTDEALLIKLLYEKFQAEITEIDLQKEDLYGIQFYKYNSNGKYITSKQWDKTLEIYIFRDLSYDDIVRIYKVLGYKLKRTPYSNEYCSSYQLIPTKRGLKKNSQYKLFN